MAVVLQMSFDFPAEYLGAALVAEATPLAQSIAEEPGFIAKIWTENVREGEAGGIYLFETRALAQAYLEMHQQRMHAAGAQNIVAKIFEISAPLTKITRGPLHYFAQ